jgi:membrane-associated phospholipid phosphatase
MNSPRIVRRLTVQEQIVAASCCAVLGALVGGVVDSRTTPFDHAMRRVTRSRTGRGARAVLGPLFYLGLPGAYIPIAYAVGLWVRHRRRRGGPAIVAAAWIGWLAHRGVKVVYVRARPKRKPPRVDSYPSGHTMGATALSLTIGHVLAREGLLSYRAGLALALGGSAAMGASRILSDDHWITDVIGGWLFGAAVGGVMCGVSDRMR